ncbi:hypothetical protein [Prosthecobacter sp.]|uniref:hypothetical protein n=1 Tax=Prosthecobacter sp. TaxID=1965333 RepID=UPI001E096B20|nr:hypothetical protein [Prosthecobacter sp.]MCB1275163.1 hypothetical protein [Prosthecobacter sp.]
MPLPSTTEVLDTVQKVPSSTWVTWGTIGFMCFAAGIAFVRGVMKQIMGVLTLAVSVGAAFYVFRHRVQFFGAANMNTDHLLLLCAAAGLLTYFVLKGGLYLLAGFGFMKLAGGMDGWKGMLMSFVPSGALLWILTLVLRLLGNLEGMESAAEVMKKGGALESQAKSIWHSLSQRMDGTPIGKLATSLDPYDIKATANLARLLILWPEGSMWQHLAAQSPSTAQALNHSRIVELGYDPGVRKAIENRDFAGLMQMKKVEEAANHPDLAPVLSGLALEQAMDSVVYQRPQPVRLN